MRNALRVNKMKKLVILCVLAQGCAIRAIDNEFESYIEINTTIANDSGFADPNKSALNALLGDISEFEHGKWRDDPIRCSDIERELECVEYVRHLACAMH